MIKVDEKIEVTVEMPVFQKCIQINAKLDENGILTIPVHSYELWVDSEDFKIDINWLIEHDIETFQKLNVINDAKHQVYTDTLTVKSINFSGNFIRIGYWFDQYRDDSCHRLCSGATTHFRHLSSDGKGKIINEAYSTDCCVYW